MVVLKLVLCFLLIVHMVSCLPTLKNYGDHISSNELPGFSKPKSNSVESDQPIPASNDVQDLHPDHNDLMKMLHDLDWDGSKYKDYAVADQIILLNTRNKNYHISDFKEFDMKLSAEEKQLRNPQKRKRTRRSSINNMEWPKHSDGNVYLPYTVSSYLDNKVITNLTKAVEEYKKHTCIRLVELKDETNYLNIIADGGCYSYIGMQGGGQYLSLDVGCHSLGTIEHEFMHALGFHHEQSRRDRDSHIRIHWDNIPIDWHRQFEMDDYGEAFVMGESYDEGSVMHYGNKAAAIDGSRNTITAINNPFSKLGQREGFSQQDIREINLKYRCEKYLNI